VFASLVGTPLDDHNVRRQFRVITEAAEFGPAVREVHPDRPAVTRPAGHHGHALPAGGFRPAC
jgi:hypothetical protein